MPNPVGSSSGAESTRKYPEAKEVIRELSNKDDVLKKLKEADERAVKALEDRGIPATVEAAAQRVKNKRGPKEEDVSSDVIVNPQDSATVEATKRAIEETKVFDTVIGQAKQANPSLSKKLEAGRVTVGQPNKNKSD